MSAIHKLAAASIPAIPAPVVPPESAALVINLVEVMISPAAKTPG